MARYEAINILASLFQIAVCLLSLRNTQCYHQLVIMWMY